MFLETDNGESLACFLGSDDQKLGESVAGLLLGPDVFVSLVMTGVLERRPNTNAHDQRLYSIGRTLCSGMTTSATPP